MEEFTNRIGFKNRLWLFLFGEHYDVIDNIRTCYEMGLKHGYDLSSCEQRQLGYRSAWFDSKGNKYKCKYLLNEPIDQYGRIINYVH